MSSWTRALTTSFAVLALCACQGSGSGGAGGGSAAMGGGAAAGGESAGGGSVATGGGSSNSGGGSSNSGGGSSNSGGGSSTVCTPGDTAPCGNCGTKTCQPAGDWGNCSSEGLCAPNATRSTSCGNCGTELDTCSAACTWTPGSCMNEGVCPPNATRAVSCALCGSEVDTCSASCQWAAGTCTTVSGCAESMPNAGCNIYNTACPQQSAQPTGWYHDDVNGASSSEPECMQRAIDFYGWCNGSDAPGNPNVFALFLDGAGVTKAYADYSGGTLYSSSYGWPNVVFLAANSSIQNGNITFVMQGDGNLVLYQGSTGLWASNTAGRPCASSGCSAQLQADGNLVISFTDGTTWASGTAGTANEATLEVGSTYPFPVIFRQGAPVWIGDPLTGSLSTADLADFVVQDVCNADPTQDPYWCGSNRRNLNLDEHVRYLRTDKSGTQMQMSVPFRLADGSIGALHQFDFGNIPNQDGNGGDSAFREFDVWSAGAGFSSTNPIHTPGLYDGYDLLEANGDWLSYICTCDGSKGVQPWTHWSLPLVCVADDAWLVFQKSTASWDATPHEGVASLGDGYNGCPVSMAHADTFFQTGIVGYASGKLMTSMVQTHYGAASAANAQAFERVYYTKAYGRSRWEAWGNMPPPAGYGGQCNGPTTDGNGFYRWDCRDWTFGFADPEDGWNPLTWPVDVRFGKGNRLVNGDFGAGVNYLGPWNRIDATTVNGTIVEETPGGNDLHQYNHYFAMNWQGSGSSSWYQDVPRGSVPKGGPGIAFGARLWTDQSSALATLVIWELPAGIAHTLALTLTPQRSSCAGSFTAGDATTSFRFELYLGAANAGYFMDDAFLAQQ